MLIRASVVAACLLAGSVFIQRTSAIERVPLRASLLALPYQFDGWSGVEAPPLEARVLKVLGVDEHVNRFYRSDAQQAVSLYIGYYGSQRQGDTMHSPLNCLPGSGWQPMHRERRTILVQDVAGQPARTIEVNRLEIQKGAERQVMLYWYQSRGRVIASEYWSKLFTVSDAIRLNRTDGSFVRVITPVLGDAQAVEAPLTAFVTALFPKLHNHLPR